MESKLALCSHHLPVMCLFSVLPAIGGSSLRKVEEGRKKPNAEESSAKPKKKKERAALKAKREMEEPERTQVWEAFINLQTEKAFRLLQGS